MKRSFKKLILGAVIAALAAVGTVSVMAQDDAEKNALYTKFTECYKAKDEPGWRACVLVGEEYLKKYGTPPDQYNEFVTKQVANLKKKIDGQPLVNAYAKILKGIETKNNRDIFDGTKDVIRLESKESTKLDMNLFAAQVGYDLAFGSATPNNSFNNETLGFAKAALNMMESGVVSESKPGPNNTTLEPTWGGTGVYALKNKDNASAWMNFIIGRMTSDTNKDTTKNLAVYREAAPYFYKSVKYESPDIKKSPLPYQSIGRYYLEELNVKVDEYNKSCKDLPEDTAACKNIRELQLAYAERGLDAYARALKIAQADPKQPATFKQKLNETVNTFYNARFKKTDGMNEYLLKVTTQPLTDPTTPVTPIPEETVAPPTTVKPTTTTPANTTKPAPTTPAKPNGGGKGTVAKTAPKKKTGKN